MMVSSKIKGEVKEGLTGSTFIRQSHENDA